MLGLKKNSSVPSPVLDLAREELTVSLDHRGPHDDLLSRWMSLADTQQRVIHTLISEIQRTSAGVEAEADNLSGRFRRLAVCAERQTARVDALSRLAVGVDVEGETVAIDRIAGLLDQTLNAVVENILVLSKESMCMVNALRDLAGNIGRVDRCVGELNKINRTTNMLALNARIEAERAGVSGVAFRVVAGEVRDLSRATENLAITIANEVKAVTQGISDGHATLQQVATIDMSQHLAAKDRLEVLMAALIRRSEQLKSVVDEAVEDASIISADVDGIVTGIQFQDRTRQRLEHVVDTLQVIDRAIEDLKQTTTQAVPDAGDRQADLAWLKTLLDGFTLGELRARFVAQILEGTQPSDTEADQAAAAAPSEAGTVELF